MPKPLTLLNRFDRLNRRYFKGRLNRPSMVRYAKQPDSTDLAAVEKVYMKGDGRSYILIHEGLREFDTLTELALTHAAVHLWNYQRGVKSTDDDCQKRGSLHHRKMLSILAKEPTLC